MKKRKLLIVMATVTVVGASIAACGTTSTTSTKTNTTATPATESVRVDDDTNSTDSEPDTAADVSNSYNNTAELLAKFPIVNATPVDSDMEKGIQNRLLNGFENWNRGYDAWKAWGDILYTKDSIYNVHGARLTLAEYQASMDATLSKINIQMGKFNNMIICDDWAAIHYDINTTVQGKTNPGSTMEFIHFKDYGDDLGVRVVEGWGGAKDDSFDAMSMFQTEEEKKAQQEATNAVLNYVIPTTDDLAVKYPIKNPTTDHSDNATAIKNSILKDFDAWNQGADKWSTEADSFYSTNATIEGKSGVMSLAEYKDSVKKAEKTTNVKKLYFDNILISGDWAAIHYRYTSENLETKEKAAGDSMQFIHFVKDGDGVKADSTWMK